MLVLVDVDDEREKLKLALFESEMERCDCSDKREVERCRASPSYDFFVCEGARFGIAGASTDGVLRACLGAVK